jgi:hypothetical protein
MKVKYFMMRIKVISQCGVQNCSGYYGNVTGSHNIEMGVPAFQVIIGIGIQCQPHLAY